MLGHSVRIGHIYMICLFILKVLEPCLIQEAYSCFVLFESLVYFSFIYTEIYDSHLYSHSFMKFCSERYG